MANNAPIINRHHLLEYGQLNACSNIFAFTTTRCGGVSTGAYASMNVTPYTGDRAECVRQNLCLLQERLPQPPLAFVIPYQTHGTRAAVIDEAFLQASDEERRQMLQDTDAVITARPGLCLAVSTADCIPLLLYDRTHHITAAIHAGWRGIVSGIVPRTLQQMHRLYGTTGADLLAAIGPGISLSAFEVGHEVYEAFRAAGFPMEAISLWQSATHKYHIDLWVAVRLQLQAFGIPAPQIESCGICTYSRYEEFFSARRLGIRSGRILTGIIRY